MVEFTRTGSSGVSVSINKARVDYFEPGSNNSTNIHIGGISINVTDDYATVKSKLA